MRRIEVEKDLKRAEREGLLNIQLLVVRSPPHSSSSSECVKGKVYNEKLKFAQTIIQDIDTTKTSTIKFLCISRRRWCAREQTRP